MVGELTHNVNELLHFTLTFRLHFSHFQRDKRTELISLYFSVSRGLEQDPSAYTRVPWLQALPEPA